MKTSSKILTLVGTGITVITTLIGLILVVSATGSVEGGAAVKAAAIGITIFFSILGMAVPLLAFIFVLLKRKSLNYAGYILAIIGGGLAVSSLIVGGITTMGILSTVAGILTLVGGIMGVIAIKK